MMNVFGSCSGDEEAPVVVVVVEEEEEMEDRSGTLDRMMTGPS